MCGIAGEVSFAGAAQPEAVAALVRGVRHRGPDDQGLWVSPGQECALGHARLSIIDLSPLGHQPMIDLETGNCITFNGEIYNYRKLRRDCEAAGDAFRSLSDTEVILALYRRHGVDCLARLRGMFAFAIWDERKKHLFLARDRVGKKPLNYALTERGMVFCSEIHPLARHPQLPRELDTEALELFLQLQYIPAPWTIYRHIRKLPPAYFGIFTSKGQSIQCYWDVDYTKKCKLTEDEALDGLEEKLTEAVRLRMLADVPLGALLSGGVDSSVVVALMAKLSREPVRTYSIGFNEKAFNELPFARQAAKFCGTVHHPEIASGEVPHLLPLIAKHHGEPYADVSAIPSFTVCVLARKHVTVVMNGDGGDELLGGYYRYCLSQAQLAIASFMPGVFPAPTLAAFSSQLYDATSILGRGVRKVVTQYMWPELRSIGMYTDFWNDAERGRLLGAHGKPNLLFEWRADWLAEAHRHATSPIDRMLWYDNRTYLPGDLLVKMDIASMHCGLEMRSPLLDHEVIEYCAQLPIGTKVKRGVGKYLLKKLAERYFPPSFVHRPKMGFGIPLDGWLRGPLKSVLLETLRDSTLMEPLNPAPVQETLQLFLQGDSNQGSRLWALLMFGAWRQHAWLLP